MPELSVVIVSYNTRQLLERCIMELHTAAEGIDLEVIVIDNGSTDGTLSMLSDFESPPVVIQNDTNEGFAVANNQGLAIVQAPYALLLNSDAFVTSRAIHAALDVLKSRSKVGMVGLPLVNPDGSPQAGYGSFPTLWDDIRTSVGLDRYHVTPSPPCVTGGPADWVQGACMFVRMAAVNGLGGLDPRFFMYSEEVDWCRRFWDHDWTVWYLPDVPIVHVGGASSRDNDNRRRISLYRSRLGLRRRLGGPAASVFLWSCMLAGLGLRILVRPVSEAVMGHRVGQQSPGKDWELLRAVLRMDPFARWSVS